MITDSKGKILRLILIGIILAFTLAVYADSMNGGFIHLDDFDYVLDNPNVTGGITGSSVRWAFTTFYACNWHPLTWLSHMLDSELFGLNAKGHHLINLIFHLASTIILFLLINKATGSFFRSAFVSAIFGVHPLHVESVAWISERKDVLSAFFWMCSLWSYVSYTQRLGTLRYILAVVFFSLGLMSKQMLVTLPFVMLLLDYWPLKRFNASADRHGAEKQTAPGVGTRYLIWEKVPFFALAAGAAAVAFLAQHTGGATASFEAIPFLTRLQNAAISYVVYVFKTVWPSGLGIYYPYPATIAAWKAIAAGALLVIITAAILRKAVKATFLATGWLWYLGTLLPVIGLVQIGAQAYADRYSYIPMVGLLIIASWGGSSLAERLKIGKPIQILIGSIAVLAFAIAGYIQASYWKDSVTLFERTIAVTSNNWMAHNSLGSALKDAGRLKEAIASYNESIRIKPYFPEAHNNLGVALTASGKGQEAAESFRTALHLKPDYAEAHDNLGVVLAQQGMPSEGMEHIARAIELRPFNAKAHNNMGNVLSMLGKREEAMRHYSEALRINPGHKGARKNMERLLQNRQSPAGSPFRRTDK